MQTTAQLTVAFRTVDDGHLHVLAEADVHGLETFTMPFNPSGQDPYAGRDLQYYYRPVPDLAVADLGRSAGYTLRPEGFGIAFCITEEGHGRVVRATLIRQPGTRALGGRPPGTLKAGP